MSFKDGDWIRTCQECGHSQKAVRPKNGELTNSYANSKCRSCKSEALDYGYIFSTTSWEDYDV